MKKLLLLSILVPCIASTQPVLPVISPDYQRLIYKDTMRQASRQLLTDSSNNMRNAPYRFEGISYQGNFKIRQVSIRNDNTVVLRASKSNYLLAGGIVIFATELRQHNRLPAVQKEYAQGRSAGGQLQWRGPETGELFSYGPSLSRLSFDGQSYPWDQQGRLVPGAGIPAYNNSIFRPGSFTSGTATLNISYRKYSSRRILATLKGVQTREQTIIRNNNNNRSQLSALVTGQLNKFSATAQYNYMLERKTHNNRNGFLNRVYQNSLLTPASFDNRQGIAISEVQQRSYSPQADNPLFLLADEGHGFLQRHHTGSLLMEQRFNKIRFTLQQSWEKMRQRSDEGYQPGTAFFTPGIAVRRKMQYDQYTLKAGGTISDIRFGSKIRFQGILNYLYTGNRSRVHYSAPDKGYHYQRSVNDMAISFSPDYNGSRLGRDTWVSGGLLLTFKSYGSNTSRKNYFFLPSVSGHIRFDRPFNLYRMGLKLFGGYARFASEMPLHNSLAYAALQQYRVAEILEYIPLDEVKTFDKLDATEQRESTAGMELTWKSLSFYLNWFNRQNRNEAVPVMNNNGIELVNMATHRNKGLELELRFDPGRLKGGKIGLYQMVSFTRYRNMVTDMAPGYNGARMAGFSDVYRALIKGLPAGVIVGNTWLREANNQVVIGADGFPRADNNLKVIGNPHPDFIMKMTNRITFKDKWSFNLDWEWRKGGDIWNGTQAMLDYYGRSASSAALRNTTGYVFSGVLQNGQHNVIPVSFYDPAKPVEQNRWVRYGPAGVAEDYIQDASFIRLNGAGISYKKRIKQNKQELTISLYTGNIMVWSACRGADPGQLLHDVVQNAGLDLFNLPAVRHFGLSASFQF